MKLLTFQNIDIDAVRAIAPDIEIVQANRDSPEKEARDADIVLGNPGDRWRTILKVARRLKWVHVGSAGVDGLVCPEFTSSKIVLTCTKGDVAGPVLAEHALGLVLSLTRGIARSVREAKWPTDGSAGKGIFELRGKTMGLVGFGGVGHHLARIARGLGMEVIAVRRSAEATGDESATVWGPNRLHELLGLADVVVVSVPDTPATRGMIDAEAFRKMKKRALLITVGRGKTVDTDALVTALKNGQIAGAGLDVVDPEPLPDNHPLWSMGNVVITPHIAGISPERSNRNHALFLKNLKRFVNDEPLENQVNPETGY